MCERTPVISTFRDFHVNRAGKIGKCSQLKKKKNQRDLRKKVKMYISFSSWNGDVWIDSDKLPEPGIYFISRQSIKNTPGENATLTSSCRILVPTALLVA